MEDNFKISDAFRNQYRSNTKRRQEELDRIEEKFDNAEDRLIEDFEYEAYGKHVIKKDVERFMTIDSDNQAVITVAHGHAGFADYSRR